MRIVIFFVGIIFCFGAIGVSYLALGNYLFAEAASANHEAFERFTFFGALFLTAFCASMGIGGIIAFIFKKNFRRDSNPGETAMATSVITMIALLVGLTFIGGMALEMTEEAIIAGVGAMMLSNILAVRFSFEGGKQLVLA